MDDKWKTLRNAMIACVVGFGFLMTLYVSVPDYPYNAPAWELMLWGESTQWWSEVTWLASFCVFTTLALFLLTWNAELKGNEVAMTYLGAYRAIWLASVGTVVLHYSAVYFRWTTAEGFFWGDNTGYLHGLFYILTFLVGLLAVGELVAFLSRLKERVMAGKT